MIDASYTADGNALMIVVRGSMDQVIAEGRVIPPHGEEQARVSWWPTGEHEILAQTARQEGVALERLAENADHLNWLHFQE